MIARPAALAAHVAAAIRARTDAAAWLCQPDEPEWLLAGAVTEDVAFGVARPSALEAAGPLSDLLAGFIDCRWPEHYLQAPGVRTGALRPGASRWRRRRLLRARPRTAGPVCLPSGR